MYTVYYVLHVTAIASITIAQELFGFRYQMFE